MNRISASFSAFSVPSAFAASLLLAACAPDSLTSSDSSRPLALADTAVRNSISAPGSGGASRGVATTAGTGAVADAAVPGTGADTATGSPDGTPAAGADGDTTTVPVAATDTASTGAVRDSSATVAVGDSSATVAVRDSTMKGAAQDSSASGAARDTVSVAAEVPADTPKAAEPSRDAATANAAAKALEGAWKRTGHSIEPGIAVDGVLVTDLLMQDAIESRDNLTRFQAGGVWTEDEGPMKTAPGSLQSEDGAWTLNAPGDVLSLRPAGAAQGGDHFDFKVLELSATTLKVASVSGDYSDGLSHTETITFTRQ